MMMVVTGSSQWLSSSSHSHFDTHHHRIANEGSDSPEGNQAKPTSTLLAPSALFVLLRIEH
jgi:hypothetical protein